MKGAEHFFGVSINVYILEFYRDSFRSLLARKGSQNSKSVLNVVLVSGRYLYISDLVQFQRVAHERLAQDQSDNNPRLQWILKHKHIRTLVRRDRKKKLNTDDLVFFRCLALHRQAANLEEETWALYQHYFKTYI